MKVEHVNPFIESVHEMFTTMFQAGVTRGEVGICRGETDPKDIMALIGLSGQVRGTVTLAFPVKTALAIVGRLLGTEHRVLDDTVSDAIAEVVNIVAGGAKAKLKVDGPPVDLSLPTVVRGNSFSIDYPSKSIWLQVPFESDLGHFTLRVTFEK